MASRKTLIISQADNDEVDAITGLLTDDQYFVLVNEFVHSRYHFIVLPGERRFTISDEQTGGSIRSEELASVWVAGTKHIYSEGFDNDDDLAVFNSREYSSLIDALIAIAEDIGCTIINHPSMTNHAGDKIRQQLVAMRCGFRLPEQLITNRKGTFVASPFAHRAIFKPIHSSNLHTGAEDGETYIAKPVVITPKILRGISAGRLSIGVPHFQEKLEKVTEYRVVVFNGKVYPFNITGKYDFDWRGYLPAVDFVLDDDFPLADGCLAFVNELGITLGAFDFVQTADGYFFIECNPPGYFLFCDPDNKTGMITDFASYLLQQSVLA